MEDPRAYVKIANNMRAQILDGRLKPGDQLPPISKLVTETGYSRQTIGKGLQVLEREGLIFECWGLGYFVA